MVVQQTGANNLTSQFRSILVTIDLLSDKSSQAVKSKDETVDSYSSKSKFISMFKVTFLILTLSFPTLIQAKEAKVSETCVVSYFTKSDLSQFKAKGLPIGTLSHAVNEVLKTSFSALNLADKYTLGLASALTLGSVLNTANTFEDVKPNQWNQINLTGSLIYKDTAFSFIPIRRASIKISSDKNSETIITGVQGEFSASFYKIIHYTRFRLFPFVIIERNQRYVKTLKVPIDVEVTSKVCTGTIKITELPLEPITFILSRKEPTKDQ